VRFDPDLPQTIRLEFAKSNTKVSKPKQVLAPQVLTQPPLVHPLTGPQGHIYLPEGISFTPAFENKEALSPAFIHGTDLWPHPFTYAGAEQLQQLHQQALLHPALQQQLPVRSFL